MHGQCFVPWNAHQQSTFLDLLGGYHAPQPIDVSCLQSGDIQAAAGRPFQESIDAVLCNAELC